MDALEKLSLKINQATDIIGRLKHEKAGLLSEVELLRSQVKDLSHLKQENQQHQANQQKLKTRLEKISLKIEQLMSTETVEKNGMSGGSHE